MECFVSFLRENQQFLSTSSGLRAIEEACKKLRAHPSFPSFDLTQSINSSRRLNGVKVGYSLLPSLALFCRLACVRGASVESPLDALGILDTIEQLASFLRDYILGNGAFSIADQLRTRFSQTGLCILMVTETAVAANKASTVVALLQLGHQLVRGLNQAENPFVCQPLPSVAVLPSEALDTERCTLTGVFVQCASRLIYHAAGRRFFFDQLHPTSSTEKYLGKQLVGNRQVFRVAMEFLSYLLASAGVPASPAACKANPDAFIALERCYTPRGVAFLKSVCPGILSQLATLVSLGDVFRLRSVDIAIDIVKYLVVPILTNEAQCYKKPNRGEQTLAQLWRCIVASNLPQPSAFPTETNHDLDVATMKEVKLPVFFTRLVEALVEILEVMLQRTLEQLDFSTALETVNAAVPSNRNNSRNNSAVLTAFEVVQKLGCLILELGNPWDMLMASEWGSATEVTGFDSDSNSAFAKESQRLNTVLLDIFTTTSYFLRSSLTSSPTTFLHKRLAARLEAPSFKRQLADAFVIFTASLDSLAIATALDLKSKVQTVIFKVLGFLTLLLPSSNTSILVTPACKSFSLVDFSSLLYRVMRVDWRLLKTAMLDTTSCCLDPLFLWIDKVPLDETALFRFSRLPAEHRVPKDVQKLEKMIVEKFYSTSTNSEILPLLSETVVPVISDDEHIVEASLIELLSRGIAIIHGDINHFTPGLSAIARLLNEKLSLTAILTLFLEGYDHFVVETTSDQLWNRSSAPDRVEHLSYMSRCVSYTIPLSFVNLRLSFLHLLLFTLQQKPAQRYSTDSQIVAWRVVDWLITPIHLGGFWMDSFETFCDALEIDKQKEVVDTPSSRSRKSNDALTSCWSLTNLDRITIANLLDTALMTALTRLLRDIVVFSSQHLNASSAGKAVNSLSPVDPRPTAVDVSVEHFEQRRKWILGRLKRLSYSVLKKCGSPYRWPALAARSLLQHIVKVLTPPAYESQDRQSTSNSNSAIASNNRGSLGAFAPVFLDTIAYELQTLRWGTTTQQCGTPAQKPAALHFVSRRNPLGDALLAAVSFADDNTVLCMRDIVMELTSDRQKCPEICTDVRSNDKFWLCAFKACAGIAKRLSSFASCLCRVDDESSFKKGVVFSSNVYDFSDHDEEVVTEAVQLLSSIVYRGRRFSECFVACSCAVLGKTPNAPSVPAKDAALIQLSPADDQKLSALLEMSLMLLRYARRYLFHSHPHVQYLAHLICLYSLHCQSVCRSSLLPQLHELWDALKTSFTKPVIHSEITSARGSSVSVLLLAALALRCAVTSSFSFLAARYEKELFPIVASVLRTAVPVRQKETTAKCNQLRTQLALFDVLLTAAECPKLLRPLTGECLGLRYWDAGTAVILQEASLRLVARCVATNPEPCLFFLMALVARLQHTYNISNVSDCWVSIFSEPLSQEETCDILETGFSLTAFNFPINTPASFFALPSVALHLPTKHHDTRCCSRPTTDAVRCDTFFSNLELVLLTASSFLFSKCADCTVGWARSESQDACAAYGDKTSDNQFYLQLELPHDISATAEEEEPA